MAPDLDLPNMEKPFRLYVSERVGTALGMLGQMMGPVLQLTAYLSKQLDEVARGWPTCLQAVAATTIMVKEASKLTLGQPTTLYMPHQVQAFLETKGDRWITEGKRKGHLTGMETCKVALMPGKGLSVWLQI